MNWLVKWGVKSWVLNAVNGMLETYKTSVQGALVIVDKWIAKVEAVLAFLKSLREKMADNNITDEESDAIVTEATTLVQVVVA